MSYHTSRDTFVLHVCCWVLNWLDLTWHCSFHVCLQFWSAMHIARWRHLIAYKQNVCPKSVHLQTEMFSIHELQQQVKLSIMLGLSQKDLYMSKFSIELVVRPDVSRGSLTSWYLVMDRGREMAIYWFEWCFAQSWHKKVAFGEEQEKRQNDRYALLVLIYRALCSLNIICSKICNGCLSGLECMARLRSHN